MGSNFVLMLSDMLIFPQLTAEELAEIAAGKFNAGWHTSDRIREMAVVYEVMDPAEAKRREDIIHRALRPRLNNPQDGLVRRASRFAP